MNSSEELFKLVKSLTKSEKRYFKLFAGQHSVKGVNNYINLFEAIDKLERYDEGKLRARLKNESLERNLSSIKFQLNQLILKSLRAYHSGRSVESELREYLEYIEILFNRGLYEQSRRLILKAASLAEQHEKFTYLFEVHQWEKRIFFMLRSTDIHNEYEKTLAARTNVLEHLWNQWRYTILNERIHSLSAINPRLRTDEETGQMHEIIMHPLMQDLNKATSFRSRLCYYRTRNHYANITGKRQNVYTINLSIMQLWQEYEYLIKDNVDEYKNDLTNYLNACILAEKWEEMEGIIEKAKSLPSVSLQSDVISFERLSIIELIYYLNMAEFGKGKRLIGEIEQKLELFGENIRPSHRITLCYNITIFLFFAGEYAAALGWLENILTLNKVEQRQDIQDFARILQLVIHFELHNYDILEYLHRSTYRYLKNSQKLRSVETTLLNHIKQAGVFSSLKDVNNTFKRLKSDLELLSLNENLKDPIGITEIIFWLESKIQGIPLQDLLKRKVHERTSNVLQQGLG